MYAYVKYGVMQIVCVRLLLLCLSYVTWYHSRNNEIEEEGGISVCVCVSVSLASQYVVLSIIFISFVFCYKRSV